MKSTIYNYNVQNLFIYLTYFNCIKTTCWLAPGSRTHRRHRYCCTTSVRAALITSDLKVCLHASSFCELFTWMIQWKKKCLSTTTKQQQQNTLVLWLRRWDGPGNSGTLSGGRRPLRISWCRLPVVQFTVPETDKSCAESSQSALKACLHF